MPLLRRSRWFAAIFYLGLMTACTGRIGSSAPAHQNPTPDAEPTPNPEEQPDPETPAERPAAPFQPTSSLTRRLSQDEYVHTIQDVLGIALDENERALLPEDRPLAGFSRTASGQTTLPDHVLAYAQLADSIVEKPNFSAFIDAHAPCTTTERRCGEGFVQAAGPLLFRRPLTEAEIALFADLFETAATENDFARSIRAVARAWLQSPPFLYLLEQESNADRTVTGYEMAARLSYGLWSSAPDAALYAAAAAGNLDTVEGVVAQAQRMLANTDKVRRGHGRFLTDWARLASLPNTDGLRAELIDSAQAFYASHMAEGRPLFDVLTAPRAYLTPTLAEGWRLPSNGAGIQVYDTSGQEGRLGLLAQPGVVSGMTNADGGAIVARGLFLQAQLFCSDPPDQPTSLQDLIDEFVAEQPPNISDRQIADIRLERSTCGACHQVFDPLAFGFEHFDFRGRYRTEDEHGNAIRTDGWIPGLLIGIEDQPYQRFEPYMKRLAEMTVVRRCLVQRQLEYLIGRRLDKAQEAAVRELTATLEASAGRFDDLLLAAVAHPLFRTSGPHEE